MLPICTEAAKSVHTALVGRTCEAFFEQKWYNGILFAHGGWTSRLQLPRKLDHKIQMIKEFHNVLGASNHVEPLLPTHQALGTLGHH